MFGNLFKAKLSDEEVIAKLIVKTYEAQNLLKKAYGDFLTETNELEKWSSVKHIGLFSLSLFLITSQFFEYSSRENKSNLLDHYYRLIITETVKKLTKSEITEENFNKFVAIHKVYWENFNSKFPSMIEGANPPVNDFITYCSGDIFGSTGILSQIFIHRVIAINLVEIKNYVQKELG